MSLLSSLERYKTKRSLVYLVIFGVLVLTVFNLYEFPKRAKAGISVNGNDVTISGGVYAIDDNGEIYKEPGYELQEVRADHSVQSIDREYYSYLFDDTGNKVSNSTKLTIASDATVIMEGSQELSDLTVYGLVKQPFSDRDGKINKPLYTNENWEARWTGFLAIAPSTVVYPYAEHDYIDDFLAVEVGSGDTINDSTSWSVVFRNVNEDMSSSRVSASGWTTKNTSEAQFKADTNSVNLLKNTTSSTKYVPIRVSFANGQGAAGFNLLQYTMNAQTLVSSGSPTGFSRTSFCGVGDGGLVAADSSGVCQDAATVDFDYYIAKGATYNGYNDIKFDLSNAVRTAGKKDLDLTTAFRGGFGDRADENSGFYGWRMSFAWTQNMTPFGNTVSSHSAKRASIYSAETFNIKAYDDVRRISGGLALAVSGTTTVSGDGKIALDGKGYPGYAAEMDNGEGQYDSTRGAGLGGGASNTDNNGATGNGGSHGGAGGYSTVDNRGVKKERAPTYDNQYNPAYMGSGAGVGADNDALANIAGSGGGYLKMVTKNLTFNGNGTINVNGSAGEYVGWHTQAGGAGGAVNITVNGQLQINGSGRVVTADGSNGKASNSVDRYVGGGGGMIYIAYSNSNKQRNEITDYLAAYGGDGGTSEDSSNGGGDLMNGEDGTIVLDSVTSLGQSLTVTKETYNSDGERAATFEPGDQVTVKLNVYEPGSDDRDDFKIEDRLPKTSGSVVITLKKSDGSTLNKALAVSSGGTIVLEGDSGQGIVLKQGENVITYTYTL